MISGISLKIIWCAHLCKEGEDISERRKEEDISEKNLSCCLINVEVG